MFLITGCAIDGEELELSEDALVVAPTNDQPDDFYSLGSDCWADEDLVFDDWCDYYPWNEIHSE